MRIREIRLAQGISGHELARVCRVKPPSEFKWEVGKAFPTADKLPTIAAALDCDICELFDDEELRRANEEVAVFVRQKAAGDARKLREEGSECRA